MPGPGVRALAAAVLLAAYYWLLLANPFASSIDDADRQLQADIDQSRRFFDAGQFEQALAPTMRVVQQLPAQAIYHERLARVFRALGRPVDEAAAWQQVMATSPTPVDACPMVAEALVAAGRRAEAVAAYETCASLPPVNPDFLVFLGQLHLEDGRPAEARRAFERGLELSVSYPDLHLLLGIRQFADGEPAAARANFLKFLELAPERREEVQVWLQRAEGAR
jgi:tetratricopeptide (TPR) repeat protein